MILIEGEQYDLLVENLGNLPKGISHSSLNDGLSIIENGDILATMDERKRICAVNGHPNILIDFLKKYKII